MLRDATEIAATNQRNGSVHAGVYVRTLSRMLMETAEYTSSLRDHIQHRLNDRSLPAPRVHTSMLN